MRLNLPSSLTSYRLSDLFRLTGLLFVLLVFYLLINQLQRQLIPVVSLEALQLTTKDSPVIIGRDTLAQPVSARAAALEHVRFSFDETLGWQMANIHATRRVDAPGGSFKTRYLRRFPVQAGDLWQIDQQEFQVLAVDAQHLHIKHLASGVDVHWKGGIGGQLQSGNDQIRDDICPEDNNNYYVRRDLKNYFLRLKSDWQSGDKQEEKTLFSIGGSVNCLQRFAVFQQQKAALIPNAARVVYVDQKFWLAPVSDARLVAFKRKNAPDWQRFDEYATSIMHNGKQQLEALYLGRFGYSLELTAGNGLRLKPKTDAVWPVKDWQDHKAKNIDLNPVMGDSALFAETLLLWLKVWLWSAFVVSCCLAYQRRLQGLAGQLYLLVLLLQGLGCLVVAQLAAGSLESRYVGLAIQFMRVSSLLQWGLAGLAFFSDKRLQQGLYVLFDRNQLKSKYRNKVNGLIVVLIALYMLLMMIQALGGDETGVAGFQPVEFSKWLIIWLATFSAVSLFHYRYDYRFERDKTQIYKSIFWIFTPLTAVFILMMAMLGLVRDFSPLLLILLFLMLFLMQQLPNPHRHGRIQGGISLILCALLSAGVLFALWFFYQTYQQGMPPLQVMNSDRFQVWARPLQFPHSGAQVLASMHLLGDAQAWGAYSWFGLNAPAEMSIPAVQDDFIAAFMSSHFGYVLALLYILLQLEFIFTLLKLSRELSGDAGWQVAGRIFVPGFAWMLLAHWLISWSNVTGLLPVMGQPMAMLSMGASHLLLFITPSLWVTFLFVWVQQSINAKY